MASRTISNAAQELIPENYLRKSFVVQNEDGSIVMYVKKEVPGLNTVSSTDHDLRLGPGASLAVNSLIDGEESIHARWTIIAASGTPRISIFETEEERR